ncbi:hypothetical protein PMZ80_007953 [Knufia obscura]|uniref:Putative lipase ATG15 n=1 Tax=Knufia obscura TaxID=1635080 RepID=A0ABR0RH94_9EURO|nr:hypothetical protein PMZ80_007953 [Knufia obscura]
MALDVKNSRDIPDAVPNAPRLATFTLRARSAVLIDHPSVHEQHRTDQYHDAERSRLLEHATVRPNISDKETVVNLAKMTSDAYLFDPREPDWLNTTLGFNFTGRFGWKEDGLRAHVFTTEDYNTVVVAFKGTTLDPTNRISGRDAINDNRLFSCCCRAQNPYHYPPVCDCPTGYYQCKSSCLTSSVLQNDSYYDAALDIMGRTQAMYPQATFWTVGHSLGGSLASLVGLTLNIPAVTFEAPPERLAAQRMGLVSSNHNTTIKAGRAIAHHFGNTADPVYMGACNGFFSSCSFWGFSFESQCFTGKRCAYDTVKDKGWRSSINNHRISNVIENVLKAYDDVPACEEDTECEDCYLWKFS